MRVVITGDLHLIYEDTNTDAVTRFTDQLANRPPDELVLGGDIYELWRRDMFAGGWSASRFTNTVEDLVDRGTTVRYVVGNHDEWILRHTNPVTGYLDNPVMDIETEYDGTRVFVTHGHKYEPMYNPLVNDVLSLQDDYIGQLASWLWAMRPFAQVDAPVTGMLGPAASYLDPHGIKNQPFRVSVVRDGVDRESGEAWGVYGHTHTPGIDRDARLVNWGSMVGDQQSYVEILDGEVRLVEV